MGVLSKLRKKSAKNKSNYKIPTTSEKLRTFLKNPNLLELMKREIADETKKAGFGLDSFENAVGAANRKIGAQKIIRELVRKGVDPFLAKRETANLVELMASNVIVEEAEKREKKVVGEQELKKGLELQIEKILLIADTAEGRIKEEKAVKRMKEIDKEIEELRRRAREKIRKEKMKGGNNSMYS